MSIHSNNIIHTKPRFLVREGCIATVQTFHRLHLFSLDLSERLGLRSGGMGISVVNLPIYVTARPNHNHDKLPKVYEEALRKPLEDLRALVGGTYWQIHVNRKIYQHAGLGATTQVLGATLIAAAASVGRTLHPVDLFRLGIGRVSAVGMTLLYRPGCVIEFGYRSSSAQLSEHYVKHPLLEDLYQTPWGVCLALSPPPKWTIVLGVPRKHRSLHGSLEDAFWRDNLPTSENVSAATAYTILLQVLPGIIAGDFSEVSNGMTDAYRQTKFSEENIQNDYTKILINDLRRRYPFAGITSLGPAAYALSESPLTITELRDLEKGHEKFEFITFPMSGCDNRKSRMEEE